MVTDFWDPSGLTHAELEERLLVEHRQVFRALLQDHLDLRACVSNARPRGH